MALWEQPLEVVTAAEEDEEGEEKVGDAEAEAGWRRSGGLTQACARNSSRHSGILSNVVLDVPQGAASQMAVAPVTLNAQQHQMGAAFRLNARQVRLDAAAFFTQGAWAYWSVVSNTNTQQSAPR